MGSSARRLHVCKSNLLAEPLRPARFIVESLDADTETRVLVPVALRTGRVVALLNGFMVRS